MPNHESDLFHQQSHRNPTRETVSQESCLWLSDSLEAFTRLKMLMGKELEDVHEWFHRHAKSDWLLIHSFPFLFAVSKQAQEGSGEELLPGVQADRVLSVRSHGSHSCMEGAWRQRDLFLPPLPLANWPLGQFRDEFWCQFCLQSERVLCSWNEQQETRA